MINSPRVVLIINCFNSATYLKKTINNLLLQSYKNVTLLLVDNMSTDKTIEIMKRFVRSSNNIYILPLHKHLSLVGARKKALSFIQENLEFDYFAFCDSDDLWDKQWIEKLINLRGDYDCLFCNGFEFDNDISNINALRKVTCCLSDKKYDVFSSPLYLQSVIFSKKLLNELKDKFFDIKFKYIYDIDLFIRLKKKSIRYIHISDHLFFYRIHKESFTNKKKLEILKEKFFLTRKYKLSLLRFFLKVFLYEFKLRKMLIFFIR